MGKEFFCEDFTGKDGTTRKGCGARIKLLKDAEGKTHRVTPVEIPCRDREGNLIYAYVPHFLVCETESEKAYRDQFIADKVQKDEAFRAQKQSQGGGGQNNGGFRNQGGQGQRSGTTGGGYRGNTGGGARYSR